MTFDDLLPFVYALALGLLIGFERERSHPPGVKKIGGSRTFALVALCGSLAARFDAWVVVAGLVAIAALLVVGYRRTSLTDPGTTTEIALVATYLLGALTQSEPAVAVSLGIIVTVLLLSKSRIHGFARAVVSDTEFEDALKFAVIAFVVFPLLPNRDLGPYGALNPHEIWLLVVAFTGISWVGYIAVRVLGAGRGTLVAGLAGGFVSASATTAALGRGARAGGAVGDAVAGSLLASVATFVQLEVIIAVASPELAGSLWPSCLCGAAALIAIALLDQFAARRTMRRTLAVQGDGKAEAERTTTEATFRQSAPRPFALRSALVLAAVLTGALLLGRWATEVFGSGGVYVSAGAAGLADAHAGALSSAELFVGGTIDLGTALLAIAVALAMNTVTKVVLGYATGGRKFGTRLAIGVGPALLVFSAAIGLTVASI